MAYLSECVLSAIELNPVRVVEKVYRTAGSIFYRWQFKEKKALELQPNLASVFQSFLQGKLLLKLEDRTGPKETYERSCVKKTKTDTSTTKAFEFKWSDLIHRPVYSIDGKKLGSLRKIMSDYMIVGTGLINITKYFIPTAFAESVSKKGIRLKITAYEVYLKYSYSKMKNTLINLELMPQSTANYRSIYDRFQMRHLMRLCLFCRFFCCHDMC